KCVVYVISLVDCYCFIFFFFFFSSRRRHTRSVSAFLLNRSSDLSSNSCFIKLTLSDISDESKNYLDKAGITTACLRIKSKWTARSEERRVGKECRSGWWPYN